MSLKHAANHLAAHGRGPDTELVHMTKGEINSLQSLARANGGSLTINPDTGLAEAGFLSSILPMALGAGAMYFSGGTAAPLLGGLGMGMSSAGVIGTGLGALQYARTGSLQKGLMAGLGAYGGAGLTGGLMGAGASSLKDAAASGAFDESLKNQGLNAAEAGMDISNPLAEAASKTARDAATSSNLENLRAGVSGLGERSGRDAFMTQVGGAKGLGLKGLAAASPYIIEANTPKPYEAPASDKDMGPRYKYEAGVATPMPEADPEGRGQSYFPNQRYTRLSDAEAKSYYGYAGGGVTDGFLPGEPVARMADGGISSGLGGYSDGGRLLRGPGDGVSDSIPAMIGNKQPARLADGEFVVPARIVSELGNGSTEAGARRLYAMMDRVQKARGKTVGKDKVAKNTRSEKYLPA